MCLHMYVYVCVILARNLIRSIIPGYACVGISGFAVKQSDSQFLPGWHKAKDLVSWANSARTLSLPFSVFQLCPRFPVSPRPEGQSLFISIFATAGQDKYNTHLFSGEMELHFLFLFSVFIFIFFASIYMLIWFFFPSQLIWWITLMIFKC